MESHTYFVFCFLPRYFSHAVPLALIRLLLYNAREMDVQHPLHFAYSRVGVLLSCPRNHPSQPLFRRTNASVCQHVVARTAPCTCLTILTHNETAHRHPFPFSPGHSQTPSTSHFSVTIIFRLHLSSWSVDTCIRKRAGNWNRNFSTHHHRHPFSSLTSSLVDGTAGAVYSAQDVSRP